MVITMSYKITKMKIWILTLFPIGILLSLIASYYPYTTEILYSNGINKLTRELLSILFGIFPFSVAEISIIIFIFLCFIYLLRTFYKLIFRENKRYTIINSLVNLGMLISIIYFTFVIIWGLNYQRLPFSSIANLQIKQTTVLDLGNYCETLIKHTNSLREKIPDYNGNILKPNRYKFIFSRVSSAYAQTAKEYPELGGNFCSPKNVLLSKIMSYAGISGIYFPFTSEPNVDTDIPYTMIAATACHEAAHQRGFAREDEANYISYIVCSKSSDLIFQYSGDLLALIYSMNALYTYDANRYKLLSHKYSKKLASDLSENDKYWTKFEGPLEKISTNINNVYLKANMQKSGVYSYGNMVDLLLAQYRFNKNKIK